MRRQCRVPYAPYRLWIEPTNRCNLACVMCPNASFEESELGFMDLDLYRAIVDESAGFVYDINLHHRGEPTLHPELPEMVRIAKTRNIQVKLHTNGTALTEKMSSRLIDAGLDLISFSFDGYTAEIYEKIRCKADFEKTLSNIRRFLALKQKRGTTKPKAVMEVMELEGVGDPDIKNRFIKNLEEQGLDRVIVKQPHNWGGNVELTTYQSTDFTPCTFPWHALVILWDGRVECCPHDFFGKIQLGDVSKNSLREIFNDKPIRELRSRMLSGSWDVLTSPCKECDSVRRKNACGLPLASLKYLKE